jgi:hypothetical protein
MIELTLVILAMLVLVLGAGAFAVLMAVKAVIWLILLPFRILFGLLFGILVLPLILLKVVVGGLLLLVAGPILVLGLVGAAIATAVAVIAPLFPLICIAFVVWVVARSGRPVRA